MRSFLLVLAGLTVGVLIGYRLGTLAGEDGPRPADRPLAGPTGIPEEQRPPADPTDAKRFDPETFDRVGPSREDDRPAGSGRAVRALAVSYADRSGRFRPGGLGVPIGGSPALIAVPLADVRGAALAQVEIAGRIVPVTALRGFREDLGLALLVLDRPLEGLPLAARAPGPGTVLVAIDPAGRRRRVEVEGAGFDAELRCAVLRFEPGRLPEGPALLVDEQGLAEGLVPAERGSEVAIPLAGLEPTGFPALDLSLAEYDRRFFAGSVEDLVARARIAFAEGRHPDSIAAWRRVFELEPFRRAELLPELERAWRARLDDLAASRTDTLAALRLALVDLPDAGDLWFACAGLLRQARDWPGAIEGYRRAAGLAPELVPDLASLVAAIRHEQASELVREGRIEEARDLVYAVLAGEAASVDLWLLQAELAERRRDYALAASSWRAALGLDPGLARELEPAIVRADELTAGPGRLVIDYDPRQRSITVEVGINDRATGTFVLDTGATVSMVPESLARAAGLDLSDRVPKVRLDTAGSSRIVPYTPSGSIQVGPLRLEGLSVVVGNLSGDRNHGLLGMDFLQKFHLVNDTTNGRLVLSEP